MRVIDYAIEDGRHNDQHYRLLTTILDPHAASATQLAGVYSQRWKIESIFDELKTHQRGPRTVLRSRSPDPVLIDKLLSPSCQWDDDDQTRASSTKILQRPNPPSSMSNLTALFDRPLCRERLGGDFLEYPTAFLRPRPMRSPKSVPRSTRAGTASRCASTLS